MVSNRSVIYTTRNLPENLRARLRILAVLRDETMERVLNEALAVGLRKMEQTHKLKLSQ